MPMGTVSGCCGAKTCVVVGLGNPDRTDDGVGIAVVRALGEMEGVDVWESVRTGLPLAQALVGYKRALVVDACPAIPVGQVTLSPITRHASPVTGSWLHGLGLAEAVELLQALGEPVPETWVLVIGVPAAVPFGRELSPEVAQAVPRAVDEVKRWLKS